MKKTIFGLVALLISGTAHAHTYVKCGETVDADNFTVTDYVLELSSENDRYSGVVAGNWNLKLNSEDSEWLEKNKRITARKYKDNGDTIVEVRIVRNLSKTRPVGTMYRLIGLYDEQPRLERYTFGGFGGKRLVGTYQCLSAND